MIEACDNVQIGKFRTKFGRRVEAWVWCSSGASAIEFALLAAPFVALLIAIFETILLFWAQQILQSATTESARLIMTGQVQNGNISAAQFQQDVCNDAPIFFTCSGIYVNVETFSSFSSITDLNPLQNGTFNSSTMNFVPGGPGDIELVQVFYQWPVFLGPLGFNLSNMSGNYNLMVATAVFRNEPYQ